MAVFFRNSMNFLAYCNRTRGALKFKALPTARFVNASFDQRRFASNTSKKNYYDILGISSSASEADVKKAYLKLAKKYHPDVCKDKDASTKFQEISEAYEVLSDKNNRRDYDAFRSDPYKQGFDNRGMGGASGAQDFNFSSSRAAEDIFEEIFGKNFNFGEGQHGFNTTEELMVRITFEEAARGVQKNISLRVVDTCELCSGSGVAMGYKTVSCPYCNGTGRVTKTMQGFYMQSTCSHCHGKGLYNKNPCTDCDGSGKRMSDRDTSIYIPPGIDNDQTLRMQIGHSTVYIRVQVTPSLIHKRIRENIYTDVEITMSEAALGTTIKVPGIEADTTVRIPAGTSSHTQLCLKGKGMRRLNNVGSGDQFINIKIRVPKNLTPRQRDLMIEWDQLENETKVRDTMNK